MYTSIGDDRITLKLFYHMCISKSLYFDCRIVKVHLWLAVLCCCCLKALGVKFKCMYWASMIVVKGQIEKGKRRSKHMCAISISTFTRI